jgi:hypothetical protein
LLSWLSPHDLKALISVYGYGAVGIIVGSKAWGCRFPARPSW